MTRRSYKRDSIGRFAKVAGSSAKKAKKPSAKKASGKASQKKSPPKKMSTKKKVAIAAGVTIAAGGAAYAIDARSVRKEYHRQGGAISSVDAGNGIHAISVRKMKWVSGGMDIGSMDRAYNGRNIGVRTISRVSAPRVSLRPKIQTMTHFSEKGRPIGFAQDFTGRRTLHADAVYLRPESRGQRAVVAALSKTMKDRQKDAILTGRKVVISKYRSEDSERIVRNQARQLGASNVIVQKRHNASSELTKGIIEAMDGYFRFEGKDEFREALMKAKKNGVRVK